MTSGDGARATFQADLTLTLPADWYRYVVATGAREDVPGIYEWRIDGVGIYIGKFKRIRRPTREYGLNVQRILRGQPYRKGKPAQFRHIHRALEEAYRAGLPITLTILENPPVEEINRREAELIQERGTLNGPVGVEFIPQNGGGPGVWIKRH